MILQKYLEIRPMGKIVHYYKELGYDIKGKTPIKVKIEDVSDGSKALEKRQCDCCGKVFIREHQKMIYNFKKYNQDLCFECAEKERLKRIRETSLINYGETNPMKSKEVQEKAQQTTLKNFGVKFPTQNKDIVNLRTTNFVEKYGVENPQQVSEIQEQAKKTNLKKYGAENPFGSKIIQEKIKKTNLEKYGVENPLQNKEILQRLINTNREKYGKDYVTQVKEIKEKMLQSLIKNGKVPISKPQEELYKLCKEWFPEYSITLNYPLLSLFLDIVIEIDDTLKIDLEYDGWFWHKDKGKQDYARDVIVQSKGFKVIRIRGGTTLPTKEQVIECIKYVTQKDHNFSRITLKEWEELELKNHNDKTSKTKTK